MRVVYTTSTGHVSVDEHARRVASIGRAGTRRRVAMCRITVPERHERGEFPMTCPACHLVVNGD